MMSVHANANPLPPTAFAELINLNSRSEIAVNELIITFEDLAAPLQKQLFKLFKNVS
jgi:hypothetical protein